MTYRLTIIANPDRKLLSPSLVAAISRRLGAEARWLSAEEAAEWLLPIDEDRKPSATVSAFRAALDDVLRDHDAISEIDVCLLPRRDRFRLLISDMDSTMITVECIDELADFAGVKADVAAITKRAMAGELDFVGALKERVALLEGLAADVIDQVYRERVRPMPGARILVQTMRQWGARTALVSGGFLPFAEKVGEALGFEDIVANRLDVQDGRLTGRVLDPISGPDTKLATLQRLIRRDDLSPEETLAVGDGANDLPMIGAAGLGVAYRAHPPVAEASAASIQVGNLTALLYLQGVPKNKFFAE